MNAYKPRIEAQGVELSIGSLVLGSCLCLRACLSIDQGKHVRRGVKCVVGKSQAKVFEGGGLFNLYPYYSKSTLTMKYDDLGFVSIGFGVF